MREPHIWTIHWMMVALAVALLVVITLEVML